MFALLRNRSYLRLWLAQIVAELGDGITRLVLVYLASKLSDNPIVISFVMLAQIIPGTIFGSFVGPFVDRLSKVKIMVSADLYRLIIVLLMIPAQQSLPALLGLVFLQGIGTICFEPARTSAIPRIVGEANIAQSISLSQATMTAMRMIGPSVGGLLIVFHNFTALFLFNSVTYLISALLIVGLKVASEQGHTEVKSSPQANKPTYFRSLGDGFRVVFKNQGLFALLLLLVPVTLVVGIINTNVDAAFLYAFQVPVEHFGFLETTVGIGSLAGAICAPLLLKSIRPHILLLGSLIGIGISCMLVVPLEDWNKLAGLVPIYVWSMSIGYVAAFANVPLSSLFVQLTPDGMRGRTSAIFSSAANTGNVAGLLLGGWMSSMIGIIPSTAYAGAALVVVAILFPMLKYYQALKTVNRPLAGSQNGPQASTKA